MLAEGRIVSPLLLEQLRDCWKFKTVESESEPEAVDSIFQEEGDSINYILSVTCLEGKI